jgi:hypothetical protein
MTDPGILSSPTDIEGFSLLIALQTSKPEIGARDNSEDYKEGGKSIGQLFL